MPCDALRAPALFHLPVLETELLSSTAMRNEKLLHGGDELLPLEEEFGNCPVRAARGDSNDWAAEHRRSGRSLRLSYETL